MNEVGRQRGTLRLLRRHWARGVLALLGAAYLLLALTSMRDDSVTIDEFGFLPAGYNTLHSGDPSFIGANLPLMNVLSALPLLAVDPPPRLAGESIPADQRRNAFWRLGYNFMEANSADYHRIFLVARAVTVLVVGLLGVLLYAWAGALLPERRAAAGLLAAGLVWFSPGIMAHARLVTTDAGLAFFLALAVYGFHRFLRAPTRGAALLAGITLGLAQLVKFQAIVLYPVFLLLLARRAVKERWGWKTAGVRCAALLVASVFVINAGYLFGGSFRSLGSYAFKAGGLRHVQSLLPGATPVPLPGAFVEAYDSQADSLGRDPNYLFGSTFRGGRWYYFLAVLAVKTPLPLLLLAGAAAVITLRRPRDFDPDEAAVLLAPALVILLVMSVGSGRQLGLRMILAAAPLFWLWVAVVLAGAAWKGWRVWALALLLAWGGAESWRAHPRYLTYFNQFAGGSANGYRYALDSNLDWGQGLVDLRRFMRDNGVSTIQLCYFGRVDPAVYGIDYEVPAAYLNPAAGARPRPGYLAVGVSLYARGYYVCDHGVVRYLPGPLRLDPAIVGTPVATVGNVFHIYNVQ